MAPEGHPTGSARGGTGDLAPGSLRWWIILILLSVCVQWLDIIAGPHVHFPIAFVIPVTLAGWHLGRAVGLGFALALVTGRMTVAIISELDTTPLWAVLVNAAIRLAVLVTLAILADAARQRQRLARRVQELEGLLSICSFCKKVRRPDGTWEPVELYVTERSSVGFSHGLCEACLLEHYPEYVTPEDPT